MDESLRALVRRDALNGAGVEITFEAPTREWAARRGAPTVDVYLYDIREDLSRRDLTWKRVRDEDGKTAARRLPARRYKLSYLVTAWTQRPEDEHRLLSALLACFARHECLPSTLLKGSLASAPESVHLAIAQPPPHDRSLSDVWSSLGGELKPSLDLVIIAPLLSQVDPAVAPPVRESVVRTSQLPSE